MRFFDDLHSCRQYDQWFDTLKGRHWFQREWELIETILAPCSRDRLLDVGCGGGRHLLEWHSPGMRCMGLDASIHMVELARRRLGPSVPVEHGFAESLPFTDDHFDIVVLNKTLEFLDNPIVALKEAQRVARKSVFIQVVNPFSPVGLKQAFRFLRDSFPYRPNHYFDLWTLKKLIGTAMGHPLHQWASTNTKPMFRSWKQGGSHISTSPFGDLVAIRVDLAELVSKSALEFPHRKMAFTTLIHGATREGL
ncbi:MAG: class I SAM-dependent methyltransferase [Deltaproteobacteria bacterium]|nr:class I SAM-dependent methyltransferase [Deltaproteobacteria bacterium]